MMIMMSIVVDVPGGKGEIPTCLLEAMANHMEGYGEAKVLRVRPVKRTDIDFEKVKRMETRYE